jgi:DNA polymerase elongation subunit (family B)
MYDLDLTSLYPSIIMTLNISPETKIAKIEDWDAEEFLKEMKDEYIVGGQTVSREKLKAFLDKYKYTVSSNGVMYNTEYVGLIPAILNEWFDKRVEYKDEMKKWGKSGDMEKYNFYKKRQLVQKILLNSLYGVLGLPAFRFYDLDNAEAVTLSGQTVIKKTEAAINMKYNKELKTDTIDYVQYVDTDSVFVSCLPLVKNRFPNIDTDNTELMTEKINEIATEVQDYVNHFYDVFAKKIFNTEKHRLEIKQEMIGRTGFWQKKKRYALWIISDNGVPTDQLEVKGLDIVRSSFPKSFQKLMKEVLIDILKNKDRTEIDNKILTFKKDLSDIIYTEIAKTSSIKDIKKYQEPIQDEVLGKFAKGTPAHVKAAINYNKLLKMFKCPPKYAPMKNGDKIKVVYLKSNQYGLEELAFKGDSDPEEILNFIKENIDANELFMSELDGKLKGFYDSMRWEFPSESKKTAQKFFTF